MPIAVSSSGAGLPPAPPSQYDLVHDIYGPGTFTAWLLIAYSVTIHFFFPSRENKDTIKFDFIATLLYPVVTAGHLIMQVQHYPGVRQELWTVGTTDEKLKPYVEAMRAALAVCMSALGISVWWAIFSFKRRRPLWKQLCILGVCSTWIFTAIFVTGLRFEHIYGCYQAAVFFMGALAVALDVWTLAVFTIALILQLLRQYIFCRGGTAAARWSAYGGTMGNSVLSLLSMLVWPMILSLDWFDFVLVPVPRSKYSITDLGQMLPLLGGIINVGWALMLHIHEHELKTFEDWASLFSWYDFVS